MRPANAAHSPVHTLAGWVDFLIDPLFRSSVIVAPAACGLALYAAWRGWPLAAALCILVALCAAICVYARFAVPFRLRITRLNADALFKTPAAAGARTLRVAFFSDPHLGRFKGAWWARELVDTVNAQRPDLILIGGDLVGHVAPSALPGLFAPFKDFCAPGGVFAVLGNHDYGIPGHNHACDLLALLPGLGIRVMRNDCACLGPGLRLLGLDELWAKDSDFGRAQRACDAEPDYTGSSGYTVVLGHNPDVMDEIPPGVVAHPDRTLFLFGHTHHGQIRVPFLPGAAIPIRGTLYRGRYSLPQGVAYVSAGTGENTSPTRLGTWPEIVLFDLPLGQP